MRRDLLAAGAPKAQFAGGFGDTDFGRNLYKGDDAEAVILPVEKTVAPRKRFRPLGKTILVRRAETKYGDIVLTDAAQEKPAEGTVLARGPEAHTVEVGEEIAFGRYAGAELPLNGETLLLMSITEVLGVIESEMDEEVIEVTIKVTPESEFEIPAGTVVAQA